MSGLEEPAKDEQPEVVAEDPEGYAQTEQLRAVFEARKQFFRVRRQAREHTLALNRGSNRAVVPSVTPDGAFQIFTALQEVVLAVEPLLAATGEHETLLEKEPFEIPNAELIDNIPTFREAEKIVPRELDKNFGHLEAIKDSKGNIKPRELSERQRRRLRMSAARKKDLFGGVTLEGIRVFGTREIVLAVPRGKSWSAQAPPAETSIEVFSRCQRELSELGLGFDLSEEEQQSRVDIELLEEVQEWREDNI